MSFVAKLKTVQIHGSVLETRSKQNYFDDDSLTQIFGEDRKERKERSLDETRGIGPVTSEEFDRLSPGDQEVFLGSDREVG